MFVFLFGLTLGALVVLLIMVTVPKARRWAADVDDSTSRDEEFYDWLDNNKEAAKERLGL